MADNKIEFILENLQEDLEVEVKNWLNGLTNNNDKAKLAKEIIALANTGGGYIFIEFDDQGNDLPEIVPKPNEFAAFSQDAIAGLIQRYVSPPCQCRLEFVARNGSAILHPVIIVPGNHRTPVFAARGSEDDGLQVGRVYVRRPGGYSEVARTQDDWEKLLERLVKSRQEDLVSAIRKILEPPSGGFPENDVGLENWHQEKYAAWKQIIDKFEENDPRRLEHGHWTVAFSIDPFQAESVAHLATTLDREIPKYSGWPPFTYLHRPPVKPEPHGNSIIAYLGYCTENEQPEDRLVHCDYWCVTKNGKGFLLRPMQEDREEYPGRIIPQPIGPFFDWTLPIFRLTEILKYIEALGARFGNKDSKFELLLSYYNTSGRKLYNREWNYPLNNGAMCHEELLQSSLSASLSDIEINIEELLYAILAPIFEQFEFSKLPKGVLSHVVSKVLVRQ